MNNQIVDLILPQSFNKEKAKDDLEQKWWEAYLFSTETTRAIYFWNNVRQIVKELDEIENSQPKYDREFWEKVAELNNKNFEKISIRLEVSAYYDFKKIYFTNAVKENNNKSSSYFDLHEIDLINKQYRLLQEIYYSRL